jgi:polyhydroxyalkanoate synthesis regulator phasin
MEDSTETEMNQGMKLGELCERERIGNELLTKAGELWKKGNLNAGMLKAIANELLLSSKQMRGEYDKKYH